MPTPPTGLARRQEEAAKPPVQGVTCPRCGDVNASHMRFCNNCGYQLQAPQAPQPAQPAGQAAAPQPAPGKGSVCWRCYGVGDPGAEFCKFCGARYADGQQRPAEGARPAEARPVEVRPAEARPVEVRPVEARPVEAVRAVEVRPASERPAPEPGVARPAPQPERRPEPVPPRVDRPAVDRPARGALVSILKDGSDGKRYALQDEQIDIGREEGNIVLSDDPYLSPRHARLRFRGDAVVLRDLESVNGIYLRLRETVDLADGDMLLVGQQVLRFELLSEMELPLGPATQHGVMLFGTPETPRIARLAQYTTEGVCRDVHYLYRDETVIGREQGDIVFTDDPFMSRRHAAIVIDRANRRFALRDLGSSNGTAVRFRGERALRPGDQFRVGRHLFRFEAAAGGGQTT
ncbi:MAG: FHA domain-containing protein [Sandaracinaceae bacterium]|nr:FHA domain-containing protein [Sandaracinaceae bacterium]